MPGVTPFPLNTGKNLINYKMNYNIDCDGAEHT